MTIVNVTDATLKGDVAGPTFTGKVDGSKFTGSVTYTDTTTPPVEPPPTSTEGLITGFSATNNTTFQIEGQKVWTQNANKSHCLVKLDDYTLQHEARQGDAWQSGSYNDSSNNRTEIQWDKMFSKGTQITVTERLTVLPGPISTAPFFNFNQLHTTSQTPPCPFTFQLEQRTDKLMIVAQWPGTEFHLLWKAPAAIVRGREMNLKFQMTMDPAGAGKVDAWLDGAQVVNYRGKVGGTSNDQYYWKQGIYRGATTEAMIAQFKNIHVVMG